MPSPKDIKKLMNVAKGAKPASKPDFEAVMANLPKGSPKDQLEAQLMFERLQAEKDALYAPKVEDKTKGKAALREIKGQLRESAKQKFLEPSAVKERMYHATTKDFSEFKPGGDNPNLSGPAVWMTPNKEFQPAAHNIRQVPGKPGYMYGSSSNMFTPGTNVMPLHTQIKNPLIATEQNWREVFKETGGDPWTLSQSNVDALREMGHDGILYYDKDGKLQEVVAFDPRQVKSAIGNQGTYDIENPDITKAKGGLAMAKGGKLLKALSGKAGKSLEAAQNLLQADRPLSLAERQFVADVMAKRSEELASLRPQEMGAVEAKKSKGPSPKPDRAKPKTKAEISAIAERIAPQMLGEFVRGEKGSASVVGKSRKQWEMEQELQHDMQRSREVPDVETVDLEPHLGSVMLSLPGDTSISDYDIFSIGGNRLQEPARQYGGSRFGLGHPEEAGWASGLDQAAGFQRRVNAASQQYGDVPVLANYLAMGPEGLNYATHFTDTLLKSIDPTKMSAKDIDAVNRALRAGRQGVEMPDFPGIENPEAAYLYLANNPVGRKLVFNPSMQLTTATEALGLPSGLNVRHAITEPELRDIEPGMTGFSLLQMQPGVTGLKPSRHPTYSHDIPGKFLGRTDVLMPYELTFPDTIAAIRANPKQAGNEFGTLQMLGGKQIIDQQLLDEIGEYRRRLKQLTGKAEGGVVHMQGGGNPGDVSGEMFKPKPLEIPSMFKDAAAALKAQFEKERRSMRKPGAVQDVIMRGPVAFGMGAPMDIVGMGGELLDYAQTKIPALRKPASVMDTGPEKKPTMGYAPRVSLAPEGPYGTEAAQELLGKAGLTTGEERPLFELGAGVVSPAVVTGGYKLGKALAPTAREMLEEGLERAVEPTRMYAAPPGKPGKVKAPANPVGFYNPAEKAALNLQRKQGPGSAFISDMKKLEQGVNDERIAELGLDQLASKPNVTREEVMALAEQNRIPLRESVRRPYQESDEYSETADALKESIRYREGGIQQVQAELDRVRQTAPTSPLVQQYENKIETMRQSIARDRERLEGKKPSLYGPDSHPDYNMPGGENYREIRVGLPENKADLPSTEGFTVETLREIPRTGQRDVRIRDAQGNVVTTLYTEFGDDERILRTVATQLNKEEKGKNNFYHQTHHGDEPNVLFHLRVADHNDVDGKRGLLIDELQSDWHQQGREKGYKGKTPGVSWEDPEYVAARRRAADLLNEYNSNNANPARQKEIEPLLNAARAEERRFTDLSNAYYRNVPDAPFKDNWYQLGLKRAIKEAADTGMDRVYLTTGARQADRYDLSKQIDRIDYNKNPDGSYNLSAIKNGSEVLAKEELTLAEVEQLVGKDLAKKMTAGEGKSNVPADRWEPEDSEIPQYRTLSGLDLKVGGEGMRQYYDKTYKNFLEKYAKQHGGKLGETRLPGAALTRDQLSARDIENMMDNPEFKKILDEEFVRVANEPPVTGKVEPYGNGNFKIEWSDGTVMGGYSEESARSRLALGRSRPTGETKAWNAALKRFSAEPVYYIDLTDAMRNSAKKGQSYKAGGAVTMAEGGAVDYESRFNEMLQNHIGMAEGGAVDYESRFNQMLQQHVGMADGGEVNEYNSDPDMSDSGSYIPAGEYANGGTARLY